MPLPRTILLVIAVSGCAACSHGGNGDVDVDVDVITDDGADPEGDRPFDGPGCTEVDKDGDTIPDDVEGTGDPDGDTIPNDEDEDSDGDTIIDRHEAGDFQCDTPPVDTDGDTTPDFLDLDSDGDTLTDAQEAGDDNPASYPEDTDGWGTPDFRDVDSDNDGLGDGQEAVLGLDPCDEDTDGDTFPDFEEIASVSGDPLDPDKGVGEGEDIFVLWYDGRSQVGTYSAAAHYAKNDIFFIVDDTISASGAARRFKEGLADPFLPALALKLEGLRAGLGVVSGWGMRGEFISYVCYHPFYGLLKLTEDKEAVASAAQGIPPLCPEPLDGGAALSAVFAVAGDATDDNWRPEMRSCGQPDLLGDGCFRPDARRFIVLLTEGAFPDETPDGYPEPHALEDVEALLAAQGVHLLGILAQDDPYAAPYGTVSDLARRSGAYDRTLRPLVYLAGLDGATLDVAMDNLAVDLVTNPPADVTIEKVDGDDWPPDKDPEGNGTPGDYDATGLVSTIYPMDWSPPPGVSPEEAVSHIDGLTFVRTVPDTEVSYRVYFRNSNLETDAVGYVFGVDLVLKNASGYVFKIWPVKLIVPCRAGDESVEQDEN
jgi:hypothetical protein